MSRRIKLIVAGTLIALTAMALGLTMSVVLNSNASNPGTVAGTNSTTSDNTSASQPNQQNIDDNAALAPDTASFDQVTSMLAGKQGGAMIVKAFANGPEAQGAIAALDNNNTKLTLNNKKVVNLATDAVLGDSNGKIVATDLKVGDRVVVVGKVENDSSITAKALIRLPALPKVLVGDLVSADATSLKLKNNNVEWTVTLDVSAKITRDGKDAKLTDLTNSEKVTVVGKADETAHTIVATSVVQGRPVMGDFTNGTVKSVASDSKSMVITHLDPATRNSSDLTVTVDDSTKYLGNNIKGLGDLKAGDNVLVRGQKQADGSYKATEVATGRGFMNGGMMGPGGRQVGPGGDNKGGRGFAPGGNGSNNRQNPGNNTQSQQGSGA